MPHIKNRKLKDIKPLDENCNRHGEWVQYHNNGQVCYKSNYIRGVRHGRDEAYYQNGELAYYGYYSNNRQIGYWFWYKRKKYYLCLI